MGVILKSIIPIFLVIFLGFLAQILMRKKITPPKPIIWLGIKEENTWLAGLNSYALYIALPALIFYSLAHTDRSQFVSFNVLAITVLLLLLVLALSVLLVKILRLKKETANTYITCIFWGNVAYLGFPFLDSLLPGTNGTASILVAVHLIMVFTLLIGVLEYQKTGKANLTSLMRRLIKNPLIIAPIAGLVWMGIGMQLPAAVDKAVAMVSASASPVILIAIGMFMAKKIYFDSSLAHAVVIASIKIIIVPILFVIVGKTIALPTSFDISTIMAGMPAALTPFALAEMYDLNRRIIVNGIIISTIASVFTLSALSWIVL